MSYHSKIKNIYKSFPKNIIKTPLEYNIRLSEYYGHNIYLKREDLQTTRSFKIRGAYNKINNLNNRHNLQNNQIVCASAGNHAQGVAFTCNLLGIKGDIYVPLKTPLQKINKIKYFGKDNIRIYLHGTNFNESLNKAIEMSNNNAKFLIHPFDDDDIIEGHATIGYEIYKDINPDIIVSCIGGGGLISGVSKYSKNINPECKIIGTEPNGADSMTHAIINNGPKLLKSVDNFVDGASVSLVGNKTYDITKKYVDKIYTVDNNKLCYNLIEFYQNEGIVLEPAGGLSVSCIDTIVKNELKNIKKKHNIVCILSGGNNDLTRYNEIMDKSLKYQDLIHYFIVDFPQKPGELKIFINNVLGKNDDIIRFEYIKKSNINYGKVIIGFQINKDKTIRNIEDKMLELNFNFQKVDGTILL